jgi:DNA-binding transcriptional regulator LsrR (DeoR family)
MVQNWRTSILCQYSHFYAYILILYFWDERPLKSKRSSDEGICMAQIDRIRLMTKVARMYYSQGIQQTEITDRLNIHQSTVSRLLKKAHELGIVRISVNAQSGIHSEIEEELESRFNLKQAIVVDSIGNDESQIARDLGAAGAYFLELAAKPGEVIGISSWSASLLEMIKAMHPAKNRTGTKVVQILGGVGNPAAQTHATHLAERLAHLIGGSAILLPVPCVTTSIDARKVLVRETYVRAAMDLFNQVDTVLVGIGAVEPSRLLASSGNVFSTQELNRLRKQGAVGDICLQFFNAEGVPVHSELSERIIGITLSQIRKAKRVIALAGGKRKVEAVLGALNGGWINILITDQWTAKAVLSSSSS